VLYQIEDREPTPTERAARSQVLFRAVNERIAELTVGHLPIVEMSLFICECSDEGCAESLEVTPDEYEAVRGNGARFVVVAGHQLPGVEHVVDGNGRFLVVEKDGRAAEVALAGDPRS
jgi:hypothetical protein